MHGKIPQRRDEVVFCSSDSLLAHLESCVARELGVYLQRKLYSKHGDNVHDLLCVMRVQKRCLLYTREKNSGPGRKVAHALGVVHFLLQFFLRRLVVRISDSGTSRGIFIVFVVAVESTHSDVARCSSASLRFALLLLLEAIAQVEIFVARRIGALSIVTRPSLFRRRALPRVSMGAPPPPPPPLRSRRCALGPFPVSDSTRAFSMALDASVAIERAEVEPVVVAFVVAVLLARFLAAPSVLEQTGAINEDVDYRFQVLDDRRMSAMQGSEDAFVDGEGGVVFVVGCHAWRQLTRRLGRRSRDVWERDISSDTVTVSIADVFGFDTVRAR